MVVRAWLLLGVALVQSRSVGGGGMRTMIAVNAGVARLPALPHSALAAAC